MAAPPIGWTTHAEVKRVIDGDTIRVHVLREIDVRLEDCWAPERRHDGGEESKRRLADICEGQPVVVFIPASDDDQLKDVFTFGRVIGRVHHNGVDLSESQIESGHATRTKEGRA